MFKTPMLRSDFHYDDEIPSNASKKNKKCNPKE